MLYIEIISYKVSSGWEQPTRYLFLLALHQDLPQDSLDFYFAINVFLCSEDGVNFYTLLLHNRVNSKVNLQVHLFFPLKLNVFFFNESLVLKFHQCLLYKLSMQ